ncbi:hypothetical protein QUB08_01505 [Microcoleus sp. BR0-C5]
MSGRWKKQSTALVSGIKNFLSVGAVVIKIQTFFRREPVAVGVLAATGSRRALY